MTVNWADILTNIGIRLSPDQMFRFAKLKDTLLSDELYSSVSKVPAGEIEMKHFLDSLLPVAFFSEVWASAGNILDLGTGGGFPALLLALVFPEKTVHAVDSRDKSVEFVHRMKTAMGLKNLIPIKSRAEELGRQAEYRERADLVVSRALAEYRILLEYCVPLVKIGGHALFYKGPRLQLEMQAATTAQKCLKIEPGDVTVREMGPPAIPFSRSYILLRKKFPTPVGYPRRNGIPASKPL